MNWRSDKALIEAYDALFGDSQLGHEGIVYRKVRAAEANREPRLKGAPHGAALRVRILHRADGLSRLTQNRFVSAPPARELIARDLAADVVALLSSGAEVVRRSRQAGESSAEPVRPGHLAVLVRTHREAAVVHDALQERSVPAVIGGSGSVFATPAAGDWLGLLDALERPTSRGPGGDGCAHQLCRLGARACGDGDRRGVGGAALVPAPLVGLAAPAGRGGAPREPDRHPAAAGASARSSRRRAVPDRPPPRGQLLHAAAVAEGLGSTALGAWLAPPDRRGR